MTRKSLEARLRKRAASGHEQGEERDTSKNVRNDAKSANTIELCVKLRFNVADTRNRLRIAEADFLVYRNCALPTVQANGVVVEEGIAKSIRSKSECSARSGNVPAGERNVAIDKVAIASAVNATKEGGGAAQRNHHVTTLTGPLYVFLGRRHGGE